MGGRYRLGKSVVVDKYVDNVDNVDKYVDNVDNVDKYVDNVDK